MPNKESDHESITENRIYIINYGKSTNATESEILTTAVLTKKPFDHDSPDEGSNAFGYIFLALAVLAVIGLLAFVIFYLVRRSRIDRLRKHLMPLYQYDPAEEDADWENELLNDDKQQQVALRSQEDPDHSPLGSPKLKFHADRI